MQSNLPSLKAKEILSCTVDIGLESILSENLFKLSSKIVKFSVILGDNVQIIALGAGLETLWFNLQEENQLKHSYTFI